MHSHCITPPFFENQVSPFSCQPILLITESPKKSIAPSLHNYVYANPAARVKTWTYTLLFLGAYLCTNESEFSEKKPKEPKRPVNLGFMTKEDYQLYRYG